MPMHWLTGDLQQVQEQYLSEAQTSCHWDEHLSLGWILCPLGQPEGPRHGVNSLLEVTYTSLLDSEECAKLFLLCSQWKASRRSSELSCHFPALSELPKVRTPWCLYTNTKQMLRSWRAGFCYHLCIPEDSGNNASLCSSSSEASEYEKISF